MPRNRSGCKHRRALEQPDRERAAEARDQADGAEANRQGTDRREQDASRCRRRTRHEPRYLIVRAITSRWISFVPS